MNYRTIANLIPFFNISKMPDFQLITKMLHFWLKKKQKKCIVVLKKCLPLQRFNKLMIVLQI